MKRLAQHSELLIIIILFSVGGFILFIGLPNRVTQITYCEIWRWLAAAIILLSSWGKASLGGSKKHSWPNLLLQVFALQGVIYVSYTTAFHALQRLYFPQHSIGLYELGVSYCWFWPFLAVLASIMGVVFYSNEQTQHQGMWSQLFTPFFNKQATHWLSIVLNVLPRAANLCCFSMLGCFFIVAIAMLIMDPLVGLDLHAITAGMLVMLLANSQTLKSWISKLGRYPIPAYIQYLMVLILLTGVFIVTNFLFKISSESHVSIASQFHISPPLPIIHFANSYAFSFFWLGWWISLTPLIIGWTVTQMRGYTIRTIIASMLILPSIIALLSNGHWPLSSTLNSYALLASTISLLIVFLRSNLTPNLYRAALPGTPKIKTPGVSPLLVRIVGFTGITLVLLVGLGPKGLSIALMTPGLALYLFSYLPFLAIPWLLSPSLSRATETPKKNT
jgi:hypothetical protein